MQTCRSFGRPRTQQALSFSTAIFVQRGKNDLISSFNNAFSGFVDIKVQLLHATQTLEVRTRNSHSPEVIMHVLRGRVRYHAKIGKSGW